MRVDHARQEFAAERAGGVARSGAPLSVSERQYQGILQVIERLSSGLDGREIRELAGVEWSDLWSGQVVCPVRVRTPREDLR